MKRWLSISLALLTYSFAFTAWAAQPDGQIIKARYNVPTASKRPAIVHSINESVSGAKASKSKKPSQARIVKAPKAKKVAVKSKKSKAKAAPKIQYIYPTYEGIKEVSSPTDDRLEQAVLFSRTDENPLFSKLPKFNTAYRNHVAALSERGEFIQFSIDRSLQEYAQMLVNRTPAPHVALVAMESSTGRILAMAGKSVSVKDIVLHAGFPAASLFKVVTSAAALERDAITPESVIPFRGGTYELGLLNYKPNPTTDRNLMDVSEALGRSCNPVFGRVALRFLNPATIRYYANAFGFNASLNFQSASLMDSKADIPNEDYEFARTAAGFGDVYTSPVHAATFMAAVANKGQMLQPRFVDQIISPTGEVVYKSKASALRQMIQPSTAKELLEMMIYTTTVGTSKREFAGKVAFPTSAKTGTLKGVNPVGLNNWFIAAAPSYAPRIAVSVIVINPGSVSSKASHLGRLMLEKALS